MKLKLIFCGLLLSVSVLAQEKHQERFDRLDVLHYKFEIALGDAEDKISGTTTVRIRFKQDADQFNLDLVKKNGEKGMTVLRVDEALKAIPFTHEGEVLTIKAPAKAGETREFRVTYEGVPATGLIISTNKYGDRTFFGDNWPDRGKNWLPTVDHPSDKATVEWVISAPEHYQVIANGKRLSEKIAPEKLKVTHYRSDVPIPTKVMVLGAARFAIETSGKVEGKEISSWVYPQDEEKGFYDYALATPITQWFVDRIGSFPFAKLANVQSKTQFGGMENAGNIFYSERSVTGDRKSEGLIAHEIAHQWFGNSASEANWHHVWLSEGFATYFTILYMEDTYGKERATELLVQDRGQIITFNKRQSVPVVNPKVTNYMRLLNANSYQKGSFVLHMLRQEVGDDNFWKAVRTYYDRHKLSNALTEDLKNVVEEVSGKELDWFFDQWIFQAGHPQMQVSAETDKTPRLELTQTQRGSFNFDLEVLFKYEDGSSETLRFPIESKVQVIEGDMSKKLAGYTLDPDTKLLFEVNLAGQ